MEAWYFKHFDTMEVELIKGPWENKIISQITYRRSSIGPLPFYFHRICQSSKGEEMPCKPVNMGRNLALTSVPFFECLIY